MIDLNNKGITLEDVENYEKEMETSQGENDNIEDFGATEEKPYANVIDLLLNQNLSEFKLKSKQVKIARLSEITGQDFIVEVRALPPSVVENIENKTNKFEVDEDGNPNIDLKTDEQRILTLIECIYTLDGKQLFKNHQLRNKFNVKSNNELVKKMLSPGEISKLYARFREVSGYIKTSIEDIKN